MRRAASVIALMGLVAVAAGGTMWAQEALKPEAPNSFADMADATRLPRMVGAQELFAGKLTTSFVVRGSVPEAAEATRALLAADGWQPHRARVATNALPDRLAIMNFRKGSQGLNVFITVAPAQGGATSIQYTPIMIENDPPFPKDAVRIADGRAEPAARPQAARDLVALAGKQHASAARPGQEAFEELEADDTDGLPVPKKHILSIGGRSNFQNDREATVPASLESVLAFYRRELAKLGWSEETNGAIVDSQRAALSFTTPDGPGTLTLGRQDGKTTVKLAQRKPAEAAKHRVVAKPGMGLLLIGSVIKTDATVTINRQTVNVRPGAGQKDTDGPRLELRPGTYKASVTIAGKPAFSEEVKVVAGETWGLLIGPGGILPLQVY